MASQKETIMLLKVDLDCRRCYKKVKKLLCSFPQITDQVYNEKQNTVMIKVVCCNPEKIRDKLCCKGANSIKSIEILPPPKPKPDPPKPAPEPKPDPPKPAPEPKPDPPKPKPEPPKPDPPKPDPPKPAPPPKPEPPKPDPPKPAPPPKPEPPKQPAPVPAPEQIPSRPVCCSDCYEGRTTGPCYNGFGYGYGYGYGCPPPPPPPPPAGGWWCYYDGCPPGGYGYRPGYCISRCDDYINDENPTACVIM